MKGISLTSQTVVLMILAAIVLASLVIFYMNASNPSQVGIANIAKQTNLCQQQVRFDPSCAEEMPDSDSLIKVCQELDYAKCQGDNIKNLECIQQCCENFCSS
jgi:hypothetical protein